MRLLSALILAATVAGPVAAATPLPPSALTLPLPESAPARLAALAGAEDAAASSGGVPTGAILRSLALPGWGQWQGGHRALGLGFFALEGAIWTSAAVFAGQGFLRRDSYEQTARLFAGIDLDSHDDRFRRLVGQYLSSEEYNRLVVARDAAQRHYGDFEAYNAYIEEHSLRGDDAWEWQSEDQFFQYKAERRASERAFQRVKFAVAAALVNRVASAVVAARLPPRDAAGAQAADTGARHELEWTVLPGDEGLPEHRLAWVLHF